MTTNYVHSIDSSSLFFRTSFGVASDLHLMLFPYLLYPGQQAAMTVSIFLIVAIAFER